MCVCGHWNRFKGYVGETSKRRGGAHNYGLFGVHRYRLEPNRTDVCHERRIRLKWDGGGGGGGGGNDLRQRLPRYRS